MRFLLLLFITTALSAQPSRQWQHKYNGTSHYGDRAAKVIYDHAGNVIVTGYISDRCTGEDFCTVKYNANGQKLWIAIYTGFNAKDDDEDRPTDIAVDAQNNIYVTGYSDSANVNYLSTVKYSPNGSELWSRRYKTNESFGNAICVDNAGDIYVTGYRTISFDDDIILIKYNSAGVQQWIQTYNSGFEDQAVDIVADNSNNIYVTGHAFVTGQGYDYCTLKYSSAGVLQWDELYNTPLGNYADYANAIALDDSQNVIITGRSHYFINTDDDIVTIKYTPSGATVYVTGWSGIPQNYDDEGKYIVTDNTGNAYVLGASNGMGTYTDLALIKIDENGNINWELLTDSLSNNDNPWDLAIDSSYQHVYIASDFNFGPNTYSDRNFLLQKVDTAGNETGRVDFDGSGHNFDIPFGMAVNSNGEIVMAGVSAPSDYDTDLATVKYDNHLNHLWTAYQNGYGYVDDVGKDLYVDPAGNSYACGYYSDYNYRENVIVFKVNTNGQRVWTYEWEGLKIEGSEIAKYLAVDDAGNTYVTGSIDTSQNQTDQDIFIMKLDNSGQLVWIMYYAGQAGGDDYPVGLRLKNGKLYLAGTTVNTGTGVDGLAICYDTNGALQFNSSYDNGGQSELFMAMEIDQQQNIFAAGIYNPIGGALGDALIVKFNNAGVMLWDSTYNHPSNPSSLDFFNCITVDSLGNAFAGGQSNLNWITSKYTTNGIREWTQHYSASNNKDSVCAIAIDRNNDVIVGGVFGQFSAQDFGVIKYRNDSTTAWIKRYANPAGSDDILTQVIVDDTNNVYAFGWETANFTPNYQMMLVKYDSAGTLDYKLIWTDSLANGPDYGKRCAFDSIGNLYLMGDASDHCFGNTFFNGFRWDILIAKYGYSTGVGISEINQVEKQALLAYPNPANEILNVRLNSDFYNQSEVLYTMYDINGRIVYQSKLENRTELQLSTGMFNPGLYLISAEQNGIVRSTKVILE